MDKSRQHKVKKGETLIKIAKKWKHKKWQTIWDAPENAKVRKKRADPEKIEAGDILFVPYTLQEQKAILEAKLALLSLADGERALAESMLAQAGATSKAAKLALKRHKNVDKEFKDIIAMLKKCAKDTKKMKDGVDIAWALANLGRDLGKMAKLSKQSSTATGDALAKINKEARDQAVSTMTGPVEGQAKKAGTDYLLNEKNNISKLGLIVGTIAEAEEKMRSPAFWFDTFVKLKEGKSWTEAVTNQFEQEMKNKINSVDKKRIFLTKKLQLQADEAAKAVKSMQTEAKSAIKRAKDIKKDVAALPDI